MTTRPYPAPPSLEAILDNLPQDKLGRVFRDADPTPTGRYLHWEELRHRSPPAGLSHEEWWAATRLGRRAVAQNVPLTDARGRPFSYSLVPSLLEKLHRLDQIGGGRLAVPDPIVNEDTRDRFLISSLVEEAITSSQLEGASTTRQVASEMLRTGRAPRDRDERMIYNNYRAIRRVKELGDLTPARVLELHEIVTADTLVHAEDAGRLQDDRDERVVVQDNRSLRVLHRPPPASQLQARMRTMCDFANGNDDDAFVHPLVRAIILHFWLAYDHPFVDGNGRTARALFYWAAVRAGYWVLEFVSISRVIKRAPAQYSRSFLFTESDGNDLTYFIDAQLTVLDKAIRELEDYLDLKIRQTQEVEALLRDRASLNHRQLALLGHALRHANRSYTIASHQNSHRVAYATARSDLLELVDEGLLVKARQGKKLVFRPRAGLPDLIRSMKE